MLQQEMVDRKIVISQVIDETVAERVISQIMEINDFDAQASVISTYEPQPIEIFINSAGGSATAGFAIIGAMEMSATPIIAYGLGIVASVALAIFMSADVRIAHRLARFMYHSVAYGAEGFINDHEEALKEANISQKIYDSIFEGTKITKEQMIAIRNKKSDFFFGAKQAVKLGIAHQVLEKPEPRIKIEEIKEKE